jgi:uncharacterized protein
MKPACERCGAPLPPDSVCARICAFECTFCAECSGQFLQGNCPNCGGALCPRPPKREVGATPDSPTWGSAEPYSPRKIQAWNSRSHHGWKVKLYTIVEATRIEEAKPDWDEACRIAWPLLERSASGGAGFITLHYGLHADYLLVNWWTHEDILNHQLLRRQFGSTSFAEMRHSTWMACVWEMEILEAETRHWKATAMAGAPQAYFDTIPGFEC